MTAILDRLAREQALIAAGTATACGFTCTCHGGWVCARAEHPQHGEHWKGRGGQVFTPGDPNIPPDAVHMPENRDPHIGPDGSGGWVQWCGPHATPGAGPVDGDDPDDPAANPPVPHPHPRPTASNPATLNPATQEGTVSCVSS